MKIHVKAEIILLCLSFCGAGLVFGGIQGSEHDFSAESWNTEGEICLPCHTPHNAEPSQLYGPLWNHGVTMASFTLYDSPTMKGTTEQPRSLSKACLSCHDGTVALDSYGGMAGDTFIDGDALIGTDLSDDHPVSILWEHQNRMQPALCFNCHTFSPAAMISDLPFFDGYIECSTCHDVHNGVPYPHMLRMSLDASEICLHCHGK